MNIEHEGYTREQILKALFSSARKVRYEYSLTNGAGVHLGFIPIENGSISFDSSSEVMRTFSGRVKKSDLINLDCVDYRVIPWLCLTMPDGKEAKWRLGKFIVFPSMEAADNVSMISLTGYDLGKIALDNKIPGRLYVDSTKEYTWEIMEIVDQMYIDSTIDSSGVIKSFPQEWEPGSSTLTVINDLLYAINYNPLHFDETGTAIGNAYVEPAERGIDFQYIANQTSVILDGVAVESTRYDIPNKWIRYTENPELPYLISSYENTDPESPYSTVSRGRVIVDSESVEDIADQETLDAYVRRIANNRMQYTDRIEFSTLNIPGHNFKECLWVEIPEYEIAGRYIETSWEMELVPGGTMKHICEKVVTL